jgi:hypothetical protein
VVIENRVALCLRISAAFFLTYLSHSRVALSSEFRNAPIESLAKVFASFHPIFLSVALFEKV